MFVGRQLLRSFSTAEALAQPGTKYGLRYTVSLIPGDGIGKELTESVRKVFTAANVPIDWEEVRLTGYTAQEDDSKLSQALESIRRNKIAFKGTIFHELIDGTKYRQGNCTRL